ncbi:MAG: DUF4249 domain-containing protein [Bacteroidota bacterium]|nr:DUF4249 domain-containing protein [Bacteroidota bacterium]
MKEIIKLPAWFLFVLFPLISLFLSCRNDVELSFTHEPKLCLNCILNPDSIIKADLSLSQAIGDAENFIPVVGAKIELYENNIFYGALSDNETGNYSIKYHPQYGVEYKIRVEKDGHPTFEATTKVPNKTRIESTIEITDPKEELFKRTVDIFDPKGKNQYWLYSYSINGTQKNISTLYANLYEPFFDDFNKKQETESKYGFQYHYMIRINDDKFDGNILQINNPVQRKSTIYTDVHIYMEVDIHYDKHLKTSIQALMLKEEEIPMSEPVQIYSNINNGYGIFGSCVMFTIINYPTK